MSALDAYVYIYVVLTTFSEILHLYFLYNTGCKRKYKKNLSSFLNQ